MIAPEPQTALLRPVSDQPAVDDFGDVRGAPTSLVGERDPMDAWYALVGRPGGAIAS